MKRFLHFVLLGLIVTLVACQKDEGIVSDTATTSSFTVTIPQKEVQTRAVTDAFGTGMSVNRCILEIYRDGTLYNRVEKSVNNRTVTFDNLRLVAQNTYDFVFWADCADGSEGNFTDRHYNTQSLTAISNRGNFEGNSDERDAFFAKETFEVTGTFSKPVTLKRPFGLLVVKTNDLNEIKDEALKPTGYTVTFKNMPNTFNALTGEMSGSGDISYTAEELAKADGTISMDFLWATDTEAALSDFSMTFLNNGTGICTNDAFTNIPIRRNYKTNVSGNLLTKQGTISVTIDPEFDQPDIPADIDQVKDIEAANAAFAAGKTNVIVTDVPTSDATLILPSTKASVSASLPALRTKLTVQYADEGDKPAAFCLTASSTATVELNTGATTVTLAGGQYADVTATTAANTLIVSEETTIGKLTVKNGNVEVYGSVETIASKPSGTIVTLHASTADKLKEFAANIKAGSNIYNRIVLDADIDFKNTAYTIERANSLELDGQGHKLSNYTVENTQEAGLICDAISVKFRNLIIENAAVKAVDDGGGNAYAGVLVGRSYGTIVFDNCQVVNSTVEGVNKVGGMIGFVAENHVEATDCKVVGCTISNIDVTEESGQTGGFAGYLGNLYNSTCSFTNCSVEDTEINAYMNRDDRTISKFIGCFQGDQATDVVSIDNCSVKNVTLNGMSEMARSFVSTYGDLLGGQRNGRGTVKITNSPLVYSISYPAQLYKFAQMANTDKGKTYFSNAIVKLDADIDLAGKEEWTPANLSSASKFTFDGQGHTISNMTVEMNAVPGCSVGYGNGFFSNLVGGSVRNITFDRAKVSRYGVNNANSGNCYGIVSGYAYGAVAFENVRVTNSIINGYGKVGGIVGMAADKNGISSFTKCSVTDTEIRGCYNCGGVVGLAQNLVTLKDCTTDNVTWTPDPRYTVEYKKLDTTLTDKDGNIVLVKGTYWKYEDADGIWHFAAWGDYYTDYYYSGMTTVSGELLGDGICHNK